MNEDARGTLVRSLETKQKAMQRASEDAQNEYQQQQAEIAQRILQKMAPLIDKFAKDNQYAVLMDVSQPWPQGPVLWFGANADVTKAGGGPLQRAVGRSGSGLNFRFQQQAEQWHHHAKASGRHHAQAGNDCAPRYSGEATVVERRSKKSGRPYGRPSLFQAAGAFS